ncbi:unnamed protein product, partial [Vitrella brassicaformis CCMP3155]
CPSNKPICARTSDSRFCYCIEDTRGLFGEAAEVAQGDVRLTKGVVSGKPSSLCFPAELDPCFNAVNRFAVPFDCADSLPVVERREDMGPDPRNQSWLPNERFPVPQESTFAQLVPGTYLFEDVHSNAYLDTIKNVGTGVSSCMRIQGKKNDDSGFDDFFLDLSCDTTEGVSVTLQFDCPDTGLCSNRTENELLPALAVVQGVMVVKNASTPACEGIEAQIEVALTGYVDESESLIAQQFEYDRTQRILIIGNERQDDLVTARTLVILSPAAHTGLGVMTFPDDVPEQCDVLLNERIFTVTSGGTNAGGILALAASGYTTGPRGEIIRKNPLEVSHFALDNQEAFRECSKICKRTAIDYWEASARGVAPSEVESGFSLGKDLKQALLGEALPSISYPIYGPGQSPDLPFGSVLTGDFPFIQVNEEQQRLNDTLANCAPLLEAKGKPLLENLENLAIPVSVLCTPGTDPTAPFRSFELFNTETGTSLDLVVKGKLGELIDRRKVLANCRGPMLQTFPSGFAEIDFDFFKQLGLLNSNVVGDITSIALAPTPDTGSLGKDTCVIANLTQLTDFSCRHDGKALTGNQNIVATVQVVRREGDETQVLCNETIAKLDNKTVAKDDVTVIWEQKCMMGFECFEACPAANLSAPPTAQPSTYRMTDIQSNSPALEDGTDPPPVDQWCLNMEVDRFTDTSDRAPKNQSTYYFSCEGEWADVQVRIRYDVDNLDGRIAPVNYSGNDQPQVGFVNVHIKGTVEQVWPEKCNGTLVFVEGTLVGGLSFDPVEDEALQRGKEKTTTFAPVIEDLGPGVNRTGVLLLETLITSSALIGEMEYTVINASDACDLNVTQTFKYKKNATYNSSEIDPETKNKTFRLQPVFSIPALQVGDFDNDNVTDLWSRFRMSWVGSNQTEVAQWVSTVKGLLKEVCGIGTKETPPVQIQCLPHEPIVVDTVDLSATLPPTSSPEVKTNDSMDPPKIGGINLTTIARMTPTESELKESFNVTDVSPLQVPRAWAGEGSLDCRPHHIERLNETQGGGGFIVRSVPLTVSVDFIRPDGKNDSMTVRQLCPVLTICEEAYPFNATEHTNKRP